MTRKECYVATVMPPLFDSVSPVVHHFRRRSCPCRESSQTETCITRIFFFPSHWEKKEKFLTALLISHSLASYLRERAWDCYRFPAGDTFFPECFSTLAPPLYPALDMGKPYRIIAAYCIDKTPRASLLFDPFFDKVRILVDKSCQE